MIFDHTEYGVRFEDDSTEARDSLADAEHTVRALAGGGTLATVVHRDVYVTAWTNTPTEPTGVGWPA